MINVRIQNETNRLRPRITVIGVGGAGGNAVNNMIQSGLEGCDFLVCNTDAQALDGNSAPHKIQLGTNVTRGLGAGANPEVGKQAAEASVEEILESIEGSNMVFVTAGMGGGTGTGAAPVIAQAAREAGILTIGVVTKPFHFEGSHRMKLAESGIAELQKYVDTLIVIPNQNLFRIANEKTTFSDAFKMADNVLQSGVRGVTDLMVMPGLINLDFADVRAVMAEMGKAMMGTGTASGERRAVEAAEAAISNPLLDDISMKGAKGVLINIMGGDDMTLFEVDEAANRIRDEVDPDANIIFGSTFSADLKGQMRVSVVATGIEAGSMQQERPLHLMKGAIGNINQGRKAQPAAKAKVDFVPAEKEYKYAQQPAAVTTEQEPQYATKPIAKTATAASSASYGDLLDMANTSSSTAVSYKPVSYGTSENGPMSAVATSTVSTTSYNTAASGSEEGFADMGYVSFHDNASVATSAARKFDDSMYDNSSYAASPAAPAPKSNQPQAMRQGNVFIPPAPVEGSSRSSSDLFVDEFAADPKARKNSTAPEAAEKPVKKSPSFFERFSLQRSPKEEDTFKDEKQSASSAPMLRVEQGGNQDEDELDIPAFLRRQAS